MAVLSHYSMWLIFFISAPWHFYFWWLITEYVHVVSQCGVFSPFNCFFHDSMHHPVEEICIARPTRRCAAQNACLGRNQQNTAYLFVIFVSVSCCSIHLFTWNKNISYCIFKKSPKLDQNQKSHNTTQNTKPFTFGEFFWVDMKRF